MTVCFYHCRKQSLLNNNFNSICQPYTTQFNGQTPLSQIISSGSSHVPDSSSTLLDSLCTKRRKQSTIVSSSSSSAASKRGVLPKSATSIMRSWLFQHIVSVDLLSFFISKPLYVFQGSSVSNRR